MALGEFTKENVWRMELVVEELFNAIPYSLRKDYLDRLSEIYWFLDAAAKVAPTR